MAEIQQRDISAILERARFDLRNFVVRQIYFGQIEIFERQFLHNRNKILGNVQKLMTNLLLKKIIALKSIRVVIFEKQWTHLGKLQLIEHLEVDLFNEVASEIDDADSGDRSEGSATDVVDLVVAQIQSSEKTHAAESVRVQLPDLIVTQI